VQSLKNIDGESNKRLETISKPSFEPEPGAGRQIEILDVARDSSGLKLSPDYLSR
jgi:hypothetical protein